VLVFVSTLGIHLLLHSARYSHWYSLYHSLTDDCDIVFGIDIPWYHWLHSEKSSLSIYSHCCGDPTFPIQYSLSILKVFDGKNSLIGIVSDLFNYWRSIVASTVTYSDYCVKAMMSVFSIPILRYWHCLSHSRYSDREKLMQSIFIRYSGHCRDSNHSVMEVTKKKRKTLYSIVTKSIRLLEVYSILLWHYSVTIPTIVYSNSQYSVSIWRKLSAFIDYLFIDVWLLLLTDIQWWLLCQYYSVINYSVKIQLQWNSNVMILLFIIEVLLLFSLYSLCCQLFFKYWHSHWFQLLSIHCWSYSVFYWYVIFPLIFIDWYSMIQYSDDSNRWPSMIIVWYSTWYSIFIVSNYYCGSGMYSVMYYYLFNVINVWYSNSNIMSPWYCDIIILMMILSVLCYWYYCEMSNVK